MNLHVVAYPELSGAGYEMIQSVRREHNTLYRVIEPHFTLVFSVQDIPLAEFATEVKKQAAGFAAIPFCLRCAVINKDSFSDNYDAFLVPDEGHSQMVKLHDRLYSGLLARHHRLDIGYIPHISIANSTDPQAIKNIVNDFNSDGIIISGSITSIDIINYKNRTITTLEKIALLKP